MAFPAQIPIDQMPIHVLFPEHYEASKRMIVRDFAFFGTVIVGSVIVAAMLALAVS